jgi:hypothetical protein
MHEAVQKNRVHSLNFYLEPIQIGSVSQCAMRIDFASCFSKIAPCIDILRSMQDADSQKVNA